ncbi:MAG: VWA domain-containing protein [bacterium]|jgi:uncharacterized membrane protein
MFRIVHPEYLLLLMLLPLMWWSARQVRVLGHGRKTLALALRSLVILCFVLALAELEKLDQGDTLAVFFVIDRSASIPQDEQEFSLAYVQDRISGIPRDDRAGIIFFGREAAIQEIPREDVKLNEYQTLVDAEGTNIEAALGLAMAAFPEGVQKRVVLLTDGNQTEGDVEKSAQHLLGNGIDLWVMPLKYTYTQDVMVQEISVPNQIQEDEPYTVRVLVQAQEEGTGTLRIKENEEVIAEQEVEFKPGKNVYQFTRTLTQSGVFNYEAAVEVENDRRPENNQAQNFALVEGTPRVLLLEGDPQEGQYLAAALLSEGIDVEMRGASGLPGNLREMQAFDTLIISNISASDLIEPQQIMIESAVRDLGLGLIMLGGPDSFGAGGYLSSPLERALPVTMEIKQRRVIPSGALAMIMHSCEIPQGNYWSQEISLAALDAISRNDYVGFLRYSTTAGGESWLFPLSRAGDKRVQRNAILSMQFSDIGDMPSFIPTLQMAHQALNGVSANVKHIIILSDGDPAQPSQAALQAIVDDGITITTVCIAPHSPRDANVMQQIAQIGRGKFYHVVDNTQLPQIFIKEASVLRRNLIIEETFTPSVTYFSEVIQGFEQGFPQLDGYVATSSKPEAETVLLSDQEDPILAHWRYGIGKALAFTSDAKTRWASRWVNWDQFAKFWAQVVRWTLPTPQNEHFQITTTVDGDRVRLKIDAISPDGSFMNDLTIQGNRINPQFDPEPFQIRQTGPGLYEGSFSVNESGNYLMNLTYQGEGQEGYLTTGISVPYSPEHHASQQNDVLLNRLREMSGNDFLEVETDVFEHNLRAVGDIRPLWVWLLGLGIVLFFLDIAVRRVFFDLPQIQEAWTKIAAYLVFWRARPATTGPSEQMGQLMQAKSRATSTEAKHAAREEFLRNLEQAKDVRQEDLMQKTQSADVTWHEAKADQVPEKFTEEQPQDSYTQALFRAKERAKKGLDQKK